MLSKQSQNYSRLHWIEWQFHHGDWIALKSMRCSLYTILCLYIIKPHWTAFNSVIVVVDICVSATDVLRNFLALFSIYFVHSIKHSLSQFWWCRFEHAAIDIWWGWEFFMATWPHHCSCHCNSSFVEHLRFWTDGWLSIHFIRKIRLWSNSIFELLLTLCYAMNQNAFCTSSVPLHIYS